MDKLDYCQYLLSSQNNYTITNLAENLPKISHAQINRYLKNEKITPKTLWLNVKEYIEVDKNGYLVFDDTVLDKNHSHKIELVRKQDSWRVGITITIVFNPDHWDCLYKSSSICSRETAQTAALFSTMVSWFYPHIQRYTRCPQSYYPQQSQTIALPARIKWDDSLWEPKHNQHLWHEYYGLSDAEYP